MNAQSILKIFLIKIGYIFSKIFTPIFLFLFFFILMAPFAIMFKLTSKKVKTNTSYWVIKNKLKYHFKNQY
jgi:hypothetical protein